MSLATTEPTSLLAKPIPQRSAMLTEQQPPPHTSASSPQHTAINYQPPPSHPNLQQDKRQKTYRQKLTISIRNTLFKI